MPGRNDPPKPAREQLKDLFALHTGERRGFLVLIAILVVLGGWAAYEQWFREPPARDMAVLEARMREWLATRSGYEIDTTRTVELFPFDPNTIERGDWLALGLSERQADGMLRYRNKGGRFRTKRDLARMYTVSPELFATWEPYILLPDSLPKRERSTKGPGFAKGTPRTYADTMRAVRTYSERPRMVDVNTADSASLVALPGIGPSFARGILRYREQLGGFMSLDQLAEVYVLQDKPDAVKRLRELLVVDTLMVRRIPINTCTVEELAAHPYVRWKLAKPLVAYRTQHGPFQAVGDIRGCQLIDAEVFRKLAPYLSVE